VFKKLAKKHPEILRYEELEQRVLFSADFVPGLDADTAAVDEQVLVEDVAGEAQTDTTVASDPAAQTEDVRRELVFVNQNVADYEQLIADLQQGDDAGKIIEVIVLAADQSGIEQVTDALANYQNLDAVHLISHGSDGYVDIGNTQLDAAALNQNQAEISAWGDSFSEQGDFLIYGCNLAETEEGQSLVQALSSLTHTDVAASDDLTGHESLGGDWALEYNAGGIESEVAITTETREQWQGVLAAHTQQLAASQDTHIHSDFGDTNYGDSTSLLLDKGGGELGDGRLLLGFDLSLIPAGSTITGATLTMEATQNGGTIDIDVYELTEAWLEGTATWNNAETITYDTTAVDTLTTAAIGEHSWDLTTLVQAWYNGSKVNNGVLIASTETGTTTVTYDSSEGTTAPLLIIDYIDTIEPVVSSVVMSDSALKVGETSTLTIEAVTAFDNTDIDLSLANGALTAVSSADGGVTWTGTFTPTDDIEDTSNVISVNSTTDITVDVAGSVAQDAAGNDNEAATQSVQAVDTVEPTVVITDDTGGTATGDVTYTFTFSETVSGFAAGDISVSGGSKGVFTAVSGTVYTLVVTNSTTDITVDVAGSVAQDAAGNDNEAATQSVQAVDTVEPIVSSVVMSDSALLAGETSTLTITFSEAVTNFGNNDISLENGTLTAVSSADGGVTWTGTFTPTDDIEDTTNIISVGTTLTDIAGNAPLTGNTSANYTIDTKEPVVTSVVMANSALKVGETSLLTITFSEAVTAFDNTDVTLENGTLTAVSSADGGTTWTGTFTPTDNIEDTSNVITIGTALTDIAGNAPLTGNTSANYSIDTREPVVNSVVMADSALKSGETSTLTITFSEAVTNFDNTDITLENGTLTAVSTGDGGVTWTGTFTPTDDIEDTTNIISIGTALTDIAGNAPLSGNSTANYTIHTIEPVVSSVIMSDSALLAGETSTLTITFSEAVTNFDNSDINVENGTLTAVSSADGGVTWTGTFTPTDDIEDTTNIISVGTTLTDIAGNAPLTGNSSANYTIETEVNDFYDGGSLTTNPDLFEDLETDDGLDPGVEVPTKEEPTENQVSEEKQTPPVEEYLTLHGSIDADDQLVPMQDPEIEEAAAIIYLTDENDTDTQSEGRKEDRSYIFFKKDLYKDLRYTATAANRPIPGGGDNFRVLDFDSDDVNRVDVNGDYDLLRQELDESFNSELKSQAVKAKIVTITAASFGVGFVSYLLRAGSLVSSLMSSLPLWRGFDPIAIFSGDMKKQKDRNEIPNTDEPESENFFDGDAE